jgi:predicted RNA polymerase sigma factor
LRHIETVHRLDPLSIGITSNLGWAQYFTRRYEDALATFENVLERDSTLFAMHNARGRVLQQMGRWDEAVAAYRRAVELGRTKARRSWRRRSPAPA